MDLTLYTSFCTIGSSYEYCPGNDTDEQYEQEELILDGKIWNTDNKRFDQLACFLRVQKGSLPDQLKEYARKQEVS